jgi:hypothetical protein
MLPKKINYLSNKELLLEIHRSKLSYCSLVNPDYQDKIYGYYDIIINDLCEIDNECIAEARTFRSNRLYKIRREELVKLGFKSHEIRLQQGPGTVAVEDIVFRLMTYDHIPADPERGAKGRKTADHHQKVNFPPFRHYVIRNSRYNADGRWIGGDFVEVLRSHWKGDAETGEFSTEHGKMTNRLAMMLMRLVEKYAQRGNWRGYTYVDEMKGQALMQLSQIGLQFNEGRSNTPNPFSYYTAAITNSFRRILNIEKKNQIIRDDILLMHGVNPSFTRQLEHEQTQRAEYDGPESAAPPAPAPAKPGRPAKKAAAVGR